MISRSLTWHGPPSVSLSSWPNKAPAMLHAFDETPPRTPNAQALKTRSGALILVRPNFEVQHDTSRSKKTPASCQAARGLGRSPASMREIVHIRKFLEFFWSSLELNCISHQKSEQAVR